jgi:hypothetical protein
MALMRPGAPVGDNQPWRAEATPRQAPVQVQPVLASLPMAQPHCEQNPLALGRIPQATSTPSLSPLGRVGK